MGSCGLKSKRGGGIGSIFPGSLIRGVLLVEVLDMKEDFSALGNPKFYGVLLMLELTIV